VYKTLQDTGMTHEDFQSYGRSMLLMMYIFILRNSEHIMYCHVCAVAAT